MDRNTFYSKWHPRDKELVSDLSLAVDSAGGDDSKVELLRTLTNAYQGILEGYENPSMASPVDSEMAGDIVSLINTLEGTNYTVNLPGEG